MPLQEQKQPLIRRNYAARSDIWGMCVHRGQKNLKRTGVCNHFTRWGPPLGWWGWSASVVGRAGLGGHGQRDGEGTPATVERQGIDERRASSTRTNPTPDRPERRRGTIARPVEMRRGTIEGHRTSSAVEVGRGRSRPRCRGSSHPGQSSVEGCHHNP